MPDSQLQQWLTPFKATAAGPSLCALENRPEIPRTAQLQVNSKAIRTGDVFLAVQGVTSHGAAYIRQALQAGASLVLTDQLLPQDAELALEPRVLLWPDLALVLPAVIQGFYQDALAKQQLVGVTGTNGKSSTAIFINQLSNLLGTPAAVIGTLGYGDFRQLTPLANTTPHLVDLHRIFSELNSQGRHRVAMEVSSHALVQGRVDGLPFAVAVFTNLSRDHLDYHGTMEAYGAAKAQLFTPDYCARSVINVSDAFGKSLALQSKVPTLVYGRLSDCQGFDHFLGYDDVRTDGHGFVLTLHSHVGQFDMRIPLLAEFNIQNVLGAMGAMLQLGYRLPALIEAVAKLHAVPGRMELWNFPDNIGVVVDYAHTPDALEQSLLALRQQCRGHVWCVFGCGGDRDKGKRPLMGRVAEQFADHVIVTADNPRTEQVLAICDDIVAGMLKAENCQIEPDRESAIKLALIEAHDNDLILVAGKGHETYQILGTTVRDYDERQFIQQLLQELKA